MKTQSSARELKVFTPVMFVFNKMTAQSKETESWFSYRPGIGLRNSKFLPIFSFLIFQKGKGSIETCCQNKNLFISPSQLIILFKYLFRLVGYSSVFASSLMLLWLSIMKSIQAFISLARAQNTWLLTRKVDPNDFIIQKEQKMHKLV